MSSAHSSISAERNSRICVSVYNYNYTTTLNNIRRKKQSYSHQLCTICVPCVYNYTTRLNRVCLTSKMWSQLEMNGGGGKVLGCVFHLDMSVHHCSVCSQSCNCRYDCLECWYTCADSLHSLCYTHLYLCGEIGNKKNTWHTLIHTVHRLCSPTHHTHTHSHIAQ